MTASWTTAVPDSGEHQADARVQAIIAANQSAAAVATPAARATYADGAEPVSGLARDRNRQIADASGNLVAVGGSGFGLMALVAAAAGRLTLGHGLRPSRRKNRWCSGSSER